MSSDTSSDTRQHTHKLYDNIMDQYYPAGKVGRRHPKLPGFEEINRRITPSEYRAAYEVAEAAGLWRSDERQGWR